MLIARVRVLLLFSSHETLLMLFFVYLFLTFYVQNCRLFSCGTGKDGESHIVEWDENEGIVKKRYLGLGKRSAGVVQFDTKNRFLVAGDEHVIKFWDIDNVNLLAFTNAEGGLLVRNNCFQIVLTH